MAEESEQERTQEATPRKKEQAREKGQIVRSRDFSVMSVLIFSAMYFNLFGASIFTESRNLMSFGLDIPRELIFESQPLMGYLSNFFLKGLEICIPFFIFLYVVSFLSGILIGGWNFSIESIGFRAERINPLKGLARIFSMRSLIELFKSILKFLIIAICMLILFWNTKEQLIFLPSFDLLPALYKGSDFILKSYLFLSLSLILVSLVDVPWQFWEYAKKLKMTFQEIKDEYKETEGKPEVRRKIREMQRAASRRRMMDAVASADVVVTNPTHYAVAIRYNQIEDAAPIIVAKGRDLIAEQIRKVAYLNEIKIISAPPLARALYHHGQIDQMIPKGLYVAVAQILAYVYALRRYESGFGGRPQEPKELEIPRELKKDN